MADLKLLSAAVILMSDCFKENKFIVMPLEDHFHLHELLKRIDATEMGLVTRDVNLVHISCCIIHCCNIMLPGCCQKIPQHRIAQ